MSERVDAVVIGAGVVGLAVARALALSGRETLVLEAAGGIGQGASSRNSEVLHAGLYYPPGSLKAALCVQGRDLLERFCVSHGVPHAICGKLVVATAPEQHAALDALQRRAVANGVAVEALSAAQALALEPELRCTAALWSPRTGIVDSHALMLALQGDLERAGGMVALRSRVQAVQAVQGQPAGLLQLQVTSPDGDVALEAGCVVNAAGLQACAVASQCGGIRPGSVPPPRFAKGSYFALSGKSPFRHLIYPAPVDAWLGVHLTLDLAGQARFGPDLQWLPEGTDADAIDYAVDLSRSAGFEEAIRRYWPGLPDAALQPAYSGIRPKIHGPDAPAPDFRIDGPSVHGVSGLVNLLGIESPGLTSSMALAEHVLTLLAPAPPRAARSAPAP